MTLEVTATVANPAPANFFIDFTFDWLDEGDISVYKNGSATAMARSTWKFITRERIEVLSGNFAADDSFKLLRETQVGSSAVTFVPGASIRAQDLNQNQEQVRFVSEELNERSVKATGGSMTGNLEMNDANIIFEGATANDHETTLSVVDPTADQTYRLPNLAAGTYNLITSGDTDTVTSDMLTDNIDIAGTLDVTSAATFDDNATIAGNLTVNGNTTLGNATSDTITPTARVAGDLIPSADGTHDLGSSALEWQDLHLDGTANIDSLVADTADINGGTVDGAVIGGSTAAAGTFTNLIANGNVDLGDAATDSITVTGRLDSDVLPIADNTHDLGSTALKFAEVHATTFTGALTGDVTGNASTATDLAAAAKVTNSEQSSHSVDDDTYFTTSASDARYFNISSGDTIKDGEAFPDNDTTIATTAAINDRIIDLVDNVGGFVPIANETSFPAENPDVNNGAGTIVSIAEIVTSRTPSNGTVTIANGQGSNTVTINNCGTTVLADGFGCLVETTTTLNTYNFHRLTPLATEVTTVAGISANITTAANNVADINNFADVYQISGSEPSTRADNSALQDGDLCYRTDLDVIQVYDGSDYSNITPDQATINDITIVADDLASFTDLGSVADDLVANQTGGALETCADNIADIQTLADIEDGTDATDAIQTVAGISANVTTVAGVSANVTTVANSIDDVNRYANQYTISASAPGSPDEGDLWYDSSSGQNTLKFYDGSTFNAISAGISSLADDTSPEVSTSATTLDMNGKTITEVGTISGDNMAMDFGAVTDT
jgi:hypothetical protein